MAAIRELKGRIGSVQSTQKITGAMKMISSAKMRKAESALQSARPYRRQLQSTLSHLMAGGEELVSPLLEVRPVHRAAYVIFGSDEGLCGAFNVGLYKALLQALSVYEGREPALVYAIGKRIKPIVVKTKGVETVDTSFFSLQDGNGSIDALQRQLETKFLNREIDRVEIIYSHFKSMGTQTVTDRLLLPVRPEELKAESEPLQNANYIYEPDSERIFQTLIPLYVKSVLNESWLQSRTSEQAARIVAMQMANDNAKKLLDSLNLEYNKLRQQNITSELLDIVGGSMQ